MSSTIIDFEYCALAVYRNGLVCFIPSLICCEKIFAILHMPICRSTSNNRYDSSSNSDSDSDAKTQIDNLGRKITKKKTRRTLGRSIRGKNNYKISINSRYSIMQRHIERKERERLVGLDNNKSVGSEVVFEDPNWWHHLNSVKSIGLAAMLVEREQTLGDFVNQADGDDGGDLARYSNSGIVMSNRRSNESLPTTPPRTPPPSSLIPKYLSHSVSAPNLHLLKKKQEGGVVKDIDLEMAITDSGEGKKLQFNVLEYHDALNCLVSHVTQTNRRVHLENLSSCIGFTQNPNSFGSDGDLSFFKERRRLLYLKRDKALKKFETDTHALGLEEGRGIGFLQPELTSVVVRDQRSHAYQLLTVGDPTTTIECCTEAWQGENSTISSLNATKKKALLEVINNWSLADLSVSAFAYSPVPFTMERRIDKLAAGRDKQSIFLIDNEIGGGAKGAALDAAITTEDDDRGGRETEGEKNDTERSDKESISAKEDWNLMKNQIFLGLLGSTTTPRKDIAPLISQLNSAGVRFIFFSPRNMRRSKSIAIKMGIDVSFNCAISLRELEQEESVDKYRMTSNYADWDVNAQMPHGVKDIKNHLREIDNVPLLVSLFTDATHKTTTEMIEVLGDYGDTVLSVGSSHRIRNAQIFRASDLSIGVDLLLEEYKRGRMGEVEEGRAGEGQVTNSEGLMANDIRFASAIICHNCIFNFPGISIVSRLADIISEGRASFAAAVAGSYLFVSIGLSLNILVFFFSCR